MIYFILGTKIAYKLDFKAFVFNKYVYKQLLLCRNVFFLWIHFCMRNQLDHQTGSSRLHIHKVHWQYNLQKYVQILYFDLYQLKIHPSKFLTFEQLFLSSSSANLYSGIFYNSINCNTPNTSWIILTFSQFSKS